jgi:hypothetical protein
LGDPIVGPMEHQDYQERVVVGEQDKNSVVVVVATVAVDGEDLVLVAAVLDTVTVAAAAGNGVVESEVVAAVVVVVVAGSMEFVAANVLIDSTVDEVVEEIDHVVVVVVVADLVAVCCVGHLHVVVVEMHRDAAVAVADENFYAVLDLVHSTCHVVVQIEMAVVVVDDSDVEDVVSSKVVGEHFLLHLPSAKEVVPNLDRQDHCDHFGH